MDNNLIELIDFFEEAAINLSWKGSKPIEDHEAIETDYREARQALIDYASRAK